jgi:hypothetical protein
VPLDTAYTFVFNEDMNTNDTSTAALLVDNVIAVALRSGATLADAEAKALAELRDHVARSEAYRDMGY